MQDALRDSEQRVAELTEQLDRSARPESELEEQLEALRRRLDEVETECQRLTRETGHLEEIVATERARSDQLKKKLDIAESGPDKLTKKEINFWRAKAEEFDESTRDYKSRLAQLRNELKARDERIEQLTQRAENGERAAADAAAARDEAIAGSVDVERLRDTLKDREARVAELTAELEQTRAELDRRGDELARKSQALEAADGATEAVTADLDAARQDVERLQKSSETAEQRATEAEAANRALRERAESTEAALERVNARLAELDEESRSAREQIAGLEQELLEEKERTDNLSEIANERRELIAQLEDRLAEAEERYEEAKWRLGKAEHFELLVRRRKKLIKAMIERIRSKDKANTALKAGLDGLRTYKATAAAQQHKLLTRIDALTAKVDELEETLARERAAPPPPPPAPEPSAEAVDAAARAVELERRIDAQVEIIETLESELKAAKAQVQAGSDRQSEIDARDAELAQLKRELESKSDIISRLQEDADEQQRKLAKLRSHETETLQQQALSVQSRDRIEALEREVEELKAANAELTQSVDSWRRKCEFLSAEAPTAYRTAAEK
ncbi:MAG: hypothetical protein JXB36_02095 [Gammaproteobacteria bacterium]|nr:hypothetical protein [Gammaproteobacteria bacterium]